MDERTLTALRGSIAKWEAIVAGTGTDEGPNNCPLCQEFYANNCNNCPVKAKTGKAGCDETPYDDYDEATYQRGMMGMEDTKTVSMQEDAAQRELEFLRSLLPEAAT